LVNAWWEPLILFKYGFDSNIKRFLIVYISEFGFVATVLYVLTGFSGRLTTMNIIGQLIIYTTVGLILSIAITFMEYILIKKMKLLNSPLIKMKRTKFI